MPIPRTAHIALLVLSLALSPTLVLADDAKEQPKAPPTRKEKQRSIEAATRANAGSREEPLGHRGAPKTEKTWEEMTPTEQEAAKKRWLFNSGDFGPPGGSPNAGSDSERRGKGGGALINRTPQRPPPRPSDGKPTK